MTNRRRTPAPFPTREEIVRFIHENPGNMGKREIARAFHLDAAQKIELKTLLRDMELDGTLMRGRGRRYAEPGVLPNVCVVEVTGTDADGDALAKPVQWTFEGPVPIIRMIPERHGRPAPGPGDRSLARIELTRKGTAKRAPVYNGRTIRHLTASPARIMGVLADAGPHFRLRPTDRRAKSELIIDKRDSGDAGTGDLVRAEILPDKRLGLKQAKVIDNLADASSPGAASLISIHQHDLPVTFSREALGIANTARSAPLQNRADLRNIPLVTIDGEDARDFDDAVFAEPDENTANQGGWHLIVAIADVSWYVRPGSALDKAAYQRGNSVYFPDRVVPMLPETLSNGWCSLVPNEDRPCLAVHLWIDKSGTLIRHEFIRGIMRSHARLTYTQVQRIADGLSDEAAPELGCSVISNLYQACHLLECARRNRGVLELDLPERQVILAEDGTVRDISIRPRLQSHRLIEEFMITANVAAAEALEKHRQPCMYRIHDQPGMEKMEALREFLHSMDLPAPKRGSVRADNFNHILNKVRDTPQADMVNIAILRSQAQAAYHPENIGHFGLNLRRYSHFTSPIRRYSDLLVHRALIRGFGLGDGGLDDTHRDFAEMGAHLSYTERRAATAERDAIDRFTAGFIAGRLGEAFAGRVTGVTRFGLFVELEQSGADGLVPVSSLPDDYYHHDEKHYCLRGENSGRKYTIGQKVGVVLREAEPVTGGVILSLTDADTKSRNGRQTARQSAGGKSSRKRYRQKRNR